MEIDISDGDTEIRSVLILEDEGLVAMLIEDLVRDLGAERIDVFTEVAPALEAASSGDYDCAILDVVLRDSDSGGVADVLAARGIPFLFSTGSARDALAERHRHRPLIVKPFPDGDLQTLLLQTMTEARMRVAAE